MAEDIYGELEDSSIFNLTPPWLVEWEKENKGEDDASIDKGE